MPALSSPGGRAGAKAQTRPGGGFRPSFNSSLNEGHMDDTAMQDLSQQKQAAQQSSTLGQQGASKQLAQQQGAGKTPLASGQKSAKTEVRAVSNLGEELIKRPVKDVLETAKSFFDINQILNIKPEDDPEKEAKKKKIAANWQKLTKSEQAYVEEQHQKIMKEKQVAEEEKEEKKKEKEAQKKELIEVPSSAQRGYRGVAGKTAKKKAQTIVNRRKTTMNQGDG